VHVECGNAFNTLRDGSSASRVTGVSRRGFTWFRSVAVYPFIIHSWRKSILRGKIKTRNKYLRHKNSHIFSMRAYTFFDINQVVLLLLLSLFWGTRWPQVTKNGLPRAPLCFGRHVKPLVPAAFAVVSTHHSAGYGMFSLCLTHKDGRCPAVGTLIGWWWWWWWSLYYEKIVMILE
jgi:hypothetical protein